MSTNGIGYKRPPKGRPWRKGESGNPKGRPKHQLTPIQRFVLKALDTPVTVGDQKKETITAREAIVRLRLLAASKGDPTALRDLMLLEKREIPPDDCEPQEIIIQYVKAEPWPTKEES